MDRFVCTLVPQVRLQVGLRGALNFHEAMMYAEDVDIVIACVSGQDTRKTWQKSYEGVPQQRPPIQIPQRGKISASNTTGPEPMELGMAR